MYVRCPTNPRRRKTPEDRRIDAAIVEQLCLAVSSDSRILARLERGLGRAPAGPFIFLELVACLPKIHQVEGEHTSIFARTYSKRSLRLCPFYEFCPFYLMTVLPLSRSRTPNQFGFS